MAGRNILRGFIAVDVCDSLRHELMGCMRKRSFDKYDVRLTDWSGFPLRAESMVFYIPAVDSPPLPSRAVRHPPFAIGKLIDCVDNVLILVDMIVDAQGRERPSDARRTIRKDEVFGMYWAEVPTPSSISNT